MTHAGVIAGVVRCIVAAIAAMTVGVSHAMAQSPAASSDRAGAALAGVVRDLLGHPVRMATVAVDDQTMLATTDDSGRFHMVVPPGINGITIRRFGYRAVSFQATLSRDSTLVLDIRLSPVSLDTMVTTAPMSAGLQRAGFYDRMRLGLGSFVSPERVEALSSTRASGLLRDVRGIDVRCGTACVVHTRSAPDCLWLFVDGAFVTPGPGGVQSQIDDVVTAGVVYAIEVYERPSLVPSQFQGQLPAKRSFLTTKAGCGALVVWTTSRR